MFGVSNKELAKRYVNYVYTSPSAYCNHMSHMRELDMAAHREPALQEYVKEIDDSLYQKLERSDLSYCVIEQ